MSELESKEFERECAKRGLCPACLNAGESRDRDLGLGGVCLNCGWIPPVAE